ncbi:MAG TPA: ATP-binding protein [Stenomitos sp.]
MPSHSAVESPRAGKRTAFSAVLARWMILVAMLPLLVSAAVGMTLTTQAMRASVREEVTAFRNTAMFETVRILEEQRRHVDLLSKASRLQQGPQAQTNVLVLFLQTFPDLRWIGLYDSTGRLLASSGGPLPLTKALDRPFLERARQAPTMSDAQASSEVPSRAVYAYGVPFRDARGRPMGTLLAVIDLQEPIAYLHHGRIRGSGETYLVRGDGRLISESRFGRHPPLSLAIPTRGFEAAADGRSGTATYEDYRGIPVIGSYTSFVTHPAQPGAPRWILLSEVDRGEALAPVYQILWAIALVTVLMLVLVWLVICLTSRRVTEPLRQLTAGADRISQGEWSQRVSVDATAEFAVLARAFNRMAEQIASTVSELQRANDALAESDRRFRVVVDNAPVILLSLSPNGLLTLAEGKALDEVAPQHRAWIGQPLTEAFHAYPSMIRSLQRALNGEIERDEVTLGHEVFQIWYAKPPGQATCVAGLIGVATDITERKKLEAGLAETQRIAHLGSWEWDFEGDRLTWSEELYHIFAIAPAAFPGTLQGFLDRVHPEDRAAMEARLKQAVDGGQVYNAEYRIVRPDGEIRHMYTVANVRCDDQGRPIGVFGTAQDVTALKRIQEEQTRTLTLLQAQREATLDGILVIDEQGRIIGYNCRFLQLWRIPEGLLGNSREHVLVAYVLPLLKDPTGYTARVEALYRDPTAIGRDEIELKDGRVLDRYSAPVVSPQGDYFGRIWCFRDLTERRKLEDTLRDQYAQLQALDRLKNDFVNAMSHDLRIPLTTILGYSEFLEEGTAGPLTPQQSDYVGQIQKSTLRLERMVNDLLDFARMEAGTFHLSLEATDFPHKITGIVESMRLQLEEAGLRLELEVPPDMPPVCMDPDRIERVMVNLLSNAIKFTPAGGLITVRAQLEGAWVKVEVTDTGEGIAEADLPRLFKRFSQLKSGKQHKGGTGLGLSISKSIVEAHGGRIGVTSRLGTGSTFWFTLPLRGDCAPTG